MAGNGPPGLVSGWFNKTFKGVERPAIDSSKNGAAGLGNDGKLGMMTGEERKRVEERRGVME
jgi:hypothetical protein